MFHVSSTQKIKNIDYFFGNFLDTVNQKIGHYILKNRVSNKDWKLSTKFWITNIILVSVRNKKEKTIYY